MKSIISVLFCAVGAVSSQTGIRKATTSTTTASTTTTVVSSNNDVSLSLSSPKQQRELVGLTLIAGYEPTTIVTDVNAIDRDMLEVLRVLRLINNGNGVAPSASDFQTAFQLYLRGGFVAPYAHLSLDNPATTGVLADAGTVVTGVNQNNEPIQGTLLLAPHQGSPFLEVSYTIREDQDDYADCLVGALPIVQLQRYGGCFRPFGTIRVAGIDAPLAYQYTLEQDNLSHITLGTISRNAEVTMRSCPYCPFEPFASFYAYYGVAAYGDVFVHAAIHAESTQGYLRGEAEFNTNTNPRARAIAAKTGILVLNVWMEVVRMMEDAVADCQDGVNTFGRPSWDMAVAFYTGSEEGADGQSRGYLLHNLADETCPTMRTCGQESSQSSGKSFVNYQILNLFRFAVRYFSSGQCADLADTKDKIVSLMTVPLLQNVLRIAYLRTTSDSAVLRAEGAAYTASLLPRVYACHEEDATTLHNLMGTVSNAADFGAVKTLLESHYANCFRVSCDHVGGYYNFLTNDYYDGARPCDNEQLPTSRPTATASTPMPTPSPPLGTTAPAPATGSSNPDGALVVAFVLGALILTGVIAFVVIRAIIRKSNNKAQEETKTKFESMNENISFA